MYPFTTKLDSEGSIFIGYWIYIMKYLAQVHMAKDARACECISAIWMSAEISQYKFNNLFIIYLCYLFIQLRSAVNIRNEIKYQTSHLQIGLI